MGIGETVPAHKRREQQRAREETQAWLDAGNEIKVYPIGYSKDSERAQKKSGHLTTTQRKALEAVRQHQHNTSNGWVTNTTASYQAGIGPRDFPGIAERLVQRGFLDTKTDRSEAGRTIRLYRIK